MNTLREERKRNGKRKREKRCGPDLIPLERENDNQKVFIYKRLGRTVEKKWARRESLALQFESISKKKQDPSRGFRRLLREHIGNRNSEERRTKR